MQTERDNQNPSGSENETMRRRYPTDQNSTRQGPLEVGVVTSHGKDAVPPSKRLVVFLIFLAINTLFSIIFMTPIIPGMQRKEIGPNPDVNRKTTISSTLFDLFIFSSLSTLLSMYTLSRYYFSADTSSSSSQSSNRYPSIYPYHPNGEVKSQDELEEEALEQPFSSHLRRYTARFSFPTELVCVLQGIYIIVKCLARLNVEIGTLDSKEDTHPIYWIALLWSCIACIITTIGAERAGVCASNIGKYKRQRPRTNNGVQGRGRFSLSKCCHFFKSRWLSQQVVSEVDVRHHDFREALLSPNNPNDDDDEEGAIMSSISSHTTSNAYNVDNVMNCASANDMGESADYETSAIGTTDITGDTKYKAGWKDLIHLCRPDLHLIIFAFLFLLLAAVSQVLIPRYMGNILDSLSNYTSNNNKDTSGDIWKVPGFIENMKKLIVVSILGGVSSGLRGSIFTAIGGRVNVRLRMLLMDSLLSQDIGFFDTTKTGDITSRLSSDTTLVGDQVTLNVNVFLRSLVQAIGVLIFMFLLSWQLTLLAFISVPTITALSKWYGQYIRSLTKLMQKKLADGNCVSEAALGSMTTVRAFGAEMAELKEFELCMKKYLDLNIRSAFAYGGYATCVTSLPQLVTAVVLFYGGLLVMTDGPGNITSGQLVSFLLYLTSLSDAFNSIGSIFASLTQAVGAADKVFELMFRKAKRTHPDTTYDLNVGGLQRQRKSYISGVDTFRTHEFRSVGVQPATCYGEVTLEHVDMFYPARPRIKVLNEITLKAHSGTVVALVGPSGGGKSSIVSLIQNLYESFRGEVCIDGMQVHNFSPDWLSNHVSVVSQEPTLFARSIRRNIIYGLEDTEMEPTMEEIKEAARLANASSFIEALPLGYETDVGERGVQLSGGQKQRIAIARALVRKPRILLLDEATSALDAESEASVQEAIDSMLLRDGTQLSPMTVIVIAHRLSTIKNADIIYVVESGKVVETGTHEILMQNLGPYFSLIHRQEKAKKRLEQNDSSLSLLSTESDRNNL